MVNVSLDSAGPWNAGLIGGGVGLDVTESPVGTQARPPGSILVGVVEDHPLYRDAMERLLSETPEIELGVVAESVARFAAGRQTPGGVVVLDLKLPGVRDAAAVL